MRSLRIKVTINGEFVHPDISTLVPPLARPRVLDPDVRVTVGAILSANMTKKLQLPDRVLSDQGQKSVRPGTLRKVTLGQPISLASARILAYFLALDLNEIVSLTASEAEAQSKDIARSLERLDNAPPLRGALKYDVAEGALSSFKILANDRASELERRFYRDRVDDVLFTEPPQEGEEGKGPEEGITVFFVCGNKPYHKPWVQKYFAENMRFVKDLWQLERHVFRIRLQRLFSQKEPLPNGAFFSAHEMKVIQAHYDHREFGASCGIIERRNQDLLDSNIRPGLKARFIEDGLGIILAHRPLRHTYGPERFRSVAHAHVSNPNRKDSVLTGKFDHPYLFNELHELYMSLGNLATIPKSQEHLNQLMGVRELKPTRKKPNRRANA